MITDHFLALAAARISLRATVQEDKQKRSVEVSFGRLHEMAPAHGPRQELWAVHTPRRSLSPRACLSDGSLTPAQVSNQPWPMMHAESTHSKQHTIYQQEIVGIECVLVAVRKEDAS